MTCKVIEAAINCTIKYKGMSLFFSFGIIMITAELNKLSSTGQIKTLFVGINFNRAHIHTVSAPAQVHSVEKRSPYRKLLFTWPKRCINWHKQKSSLPGNRGLVE